MGIKYQWSLSIPHLGIRTKFEGREIGDDRRSGFRYVTRVEARPSDLPESHGDLEYRLLRQR
jgi:hypothetical protein